MDRIIELQNKRDKELLDRFCEKGTFIGEEGEIGGVCKTVPMSDVLNVVHVYDALIIEELKK